MDLAKLIKRFSNAFSLISEKIEYRKCRPEMFVYRDCFETIRVLTKFIKPKYLCDIGANKGHWSFVLKQLASELEHVVFFEPQSEFIRALHRLELSDVTKVVYGCGLGTKETVMTIRGGTASASFLEAAPSQTAYFPGSIHQGKEEDVVVRRLDSIYAEDRLPYPDVIKLDVQGFELDVLKGAVDVLSKAKYLVIELSFAELYSGQPALWEVLQFLGRQNFKMVDRGFEWRSSQIPHELLQMDGIFVNTGIVSDYCNLSQTVNK